MRTVRVELAEHPYDILIGTGILSNTKWIEEQLPQRRAVIVSNTTVAPLYATALEARLRDAGVDVTTIVLADGEQHKHFATLNEILDALMSQRAERKTTLIALGGGVIGDMTGFAAAIYLRGIPFIQIPTTLLAQVDSSVGGKTGINHTLGKNMIGAFYQPRRVIADIDTLRTLPDRELSAGLAEVIKYGLIDDLPFFDWLESNMDGLRARDADALAYAIERSCQNKARIVAADEHETGVRALLNLGHTFGHAIEAGLGYGTWLHGEAVGAGMLLAAHASRLLGDIDDKAVARIEQLLVRAGLPTTAPQLGFEKWLNLMAQDKKVEAGKVRFVLLKQLGQAYIGFLDNALLAQLLH